MSDSAGKPPYGSEVILLPLSSALWGVTCVQTFIYFLHYAHKDSIGTKLLVIWLWGADTAHVILATLGVYAIGVTHWGDEQFVNQDVQQYLWSLFFTALVACSVQLFFTRRLWIMSPGNPICYILPLLALAQPALYIAFLVICYGNLTKAKLLTLVNLLLGEWALSAATDVLIAMSLLFFIWKLRATNMDRVHKSTNKILERIVVLTINTGVWTAICSLFSIITATAYKATPAFTAVAFLICPLYCNTLLANLNMRDTVRGNNFSVVSQMTFARSDEIPEAQSATQLGRDTDHLKFNKSELTIAQTQMA